MAKMTSPRSGVKVRMYRQGHGDCFLLAFAGLKDRKKRDVYVLIDCGLKPSSEIREQKIDKIIDDIHDATGGHVDVVIVTHEHEDHVNGFAKKKDGKHLFDKISFGACWLAWTEDGTDELANSLRDRFRDTLVTLAFAREKVATLHGTETLADRLSDLIGTETGDENAVGAGGGSITRSFRAAQQAYPLAAKSELAALAIAGISNKEAIRYLRNRSETPVAFLRPDDPPRPLPHVKDLRVYALGPPRDQKLLLDLDPVGAEEFHLAPSGSGQALDGTARSFAQAVAPETAAWGNGPPFSQRYRLRRDEVLNWLPSLDPSADQPQRERWLDYLRTTYGGPEPEQTDPAAWRRIDEDWLGAAEGLALRLNNEVNNTSLVLAFELPRSGKVLLFTGDAQRGSWIGWSDLKWDIGTGRTIDAKELLGRCVLYKVGHHGSHNATLNGTEADSYANLGWMARGMFADDFVAMIPANTAWATGKARPWAHPLPEIEAALQKKARGRVFRSDRDQVQKPDDSGTSGSDWAAFMKRTTMNDLFFEYTIEDI